MTTPSLSAAVRRLHAALDGQRLAERGDAELLLAFVQGDEAGFAALVSRYGPMVLSVCRRLLPAEADAEDGFQATFLVLARKAGSIRQGESVAGFLHGTARRVALQARRGAARRKVRERQTVQRPSSDPAAELSWREVQGLLDEEIANLAEPHRTAFLLCCREGVGHAETARRLGVKDTTLRTWLSRARRRLHERLKRRGVELGALLAAAAVASAGRAAVPAALAASAVEIGKGAGMAMLSANVIQLAKGASMLTTTTRIMAVLIIAIGTLGFGAHRPAPRAGSVSDGEAKPSLTLPALGRVLDPDGKPVAGARIFQVATGTLDENPPLAVERGKSDDKGAFRVEVPRLLMMQPGGKRATYLMAVAPGHGPAMVALNTLQPGRPTDLHLARDDQAVEGQLLDLEGRPVKGATIRPVGLISPHGDLQRWSDAMAKAERGGDQPEDGQIYAPVGIPGLPAKLTTDDKGRFRLTGVGRERLVMLMVSGRDVQTDTVLVATRAKPLAMPSSPGQEPSLQIYGASFRHAVGPPQPIVGRVLDRETGKPIAGATVELAQGEAGVTRATSDSMGEFRLDSTSAIMGRDESADRPPLVLARAPEGQPYLSAARQPERAPRGKPMTLDFRLTRGVWVTGKVVDKATGRPVRARVDYYLDAKNRRLPDAADYPSREWPWNSGQRTENAGTFRIATLPGPGVIAVKAEAGPYLPADNVAEEQTRLVVPTVYPLRNANALLRVDVPADGLELTATVDPGTSLAGVIEDADGKPLAGARAYGVEGENWTSQRPLPTAAFTAAALHPTQKRFLHFAHPEKKLAAFVEVTGETEAPLKVRLQPAGAISGRVLTPEGKPWANQPLWVAYDKPGKGYLVQTRDRLKTDAAGRFHLDTLTPGLTYQVCVADDKDQTIAVVINPVKVKPGEKRELNDLKARLLRD